MCDDSSPRLHRLDVLSEYTAEDLAMVQGLVPFLILLFFQIEMEPYMHLTSLVSMENRLHGENTGILMS